MKFKEYLKVNYLIVIQDMSQNWGSRQLLITKDPRTFFIGECPVRSSKIHLVLDKNRHNAHVQAHIEMKEN